MFSPEFRNRLDNIIWFSHLSPEVIHQVVDKFIVELQAQLDAKGVSLEVSDEARDWLAEKGYDKAMGARPMARTVQDSLKKPLGLMHRAFGFAFFSTQEVIGQFTFLTIQRH